MFTNKLKPSWGILHATSADARSAKTGGVKLIYLMQKREWERGRNNKQTCDHRMTGSMFKQDHGKWWNMVKVIWSARCIWLLKLLIREQTCRTC
jgi:hypothetical protein